MNATETVRLCRAIAACCPSQKFEEETPDVWHPVLEDIRLVDALEVLKLLAREQQYISTTDIVQAVRKLRNDRLARAAQPVPPPNLTPGQQSAWTRNWRRAVADGNPTVELPSAELTQN